MSIPIRFMSAVLVKDVLEAHFPGGLAGFQEAYPGLPEDKHLVRLTAMSWDDLAASLDALRALGVPLTGHCAIADMMVGPLQPCGRIAIEADEDAPWAGWSAHLLA